MAYPTLPRDLIKRAENENFPLIGLGALRELRKALDELEAAAILHARELGASSTDIGEALGLTRQAAYYRIRHLLERGVDDEGGADDVMTLPDAAPAGEPRP